MSTYEISKSSLLSLKAEILRKQQELVKAKADNEVKIKIIKKKSPLEIKNKGIEARQSNDVSEEDADLLRKSRYMLEAKSKLYDKLSSEKLNDEEKEYNKRYLVRFDKKNKSDLNNLPPNDYDDLPDEYPESKEDCYYSDEDNMDKDPGDIWVDYIDCLGRTRKCLQKDLNYLKSQDEELKNTIEARKQNKLHTDFISGKDINNDVEGMNEEKDMIKDKNDITEESEMLSSHMRRELLRQQWEKEEEELRNKSDIHYQDILFGEARTHGVGYYGFSKDEEERAKQQEALRKLRDETEHKQKRAQELKALREKQLAARIKAAKNRKRTRLGLPPEEEEIQPTPESEISKDEKKKLEEFTQAEEEKQRALEEARKRHLRPWDVGKEGVKQHYVMSQEEWVEKKRAERPEEFAPPSSHRKEFRSFFKTLETEDTDKSLNFTTKKINRKEQKTNLNPYKSFVCNANSLEKSKNKKEETLKKKWYYEDKKDNFTDILENTDFQEINRSASVDPTPITNLCEEIDFDDRRLNDYNKIMKNIQGIDSRKRYSEETLDSEDNGNRGIGLEIAPPPTFNYYGPGHNKKPRTTPKATNIHESIEAGLKYLRRQVEEKEKSTKHPREIYLS